MARPVTLCTLQWGDLPLQTVCEKAKSFGFDGLELGLPAHVDVRETDPAYYQGIKNMLDQYGLKLFSISTHLISQAICDRIDERHRSVLPDYIWGDGEEEGIHQRAAEHLIQAARAARMLGVDTVNGFTGSPIWQWLYSFPPVSGGRSPTVSYPHLFWSFFLPSCIPLLFCLFSFISLYTAS